MIDVEVVPELSLRCSAWEFVLGMPLQQTIEILKKLDNAINTVDFWYSEKLPFTFNILLHLPNDGIKLHFDPKFQRLTLIEITDLSRVTLSYWSKYFNSPNHIPTLQNIIRTFGSTKQLLPDDYPGNYRLSYRGITFILASPTRTESELITVTPTPLANEKLNSSPLLDTSLEAKLVAKRIFVYLGQNVTEAKLPIYLPPNCFHGNIFLERLSVVRSGELTKKLTLDLIYQELCINLTREPSAKRFSISVAFGNTVQDVLTALGSPSRIFYKTEDKMKIHLPQPYRQSRQRYSDFFYNYFTLGLDILFDARTCTVISFVLHTNQPGEYTFNTYHRCMFEIPITSLSKDGTEKTLTITPFVNWSSIRPFLAGAVDAEPVVIHRETKRFKNPFGATNAYGYQDLIFEVLPQNGYLGSVTIYSLPEIMQH